MPEAEYPLTFARDGAGATEGKATLDDESLSILPSSGEPASLSLRDIEGIIAADYRITISLAGGGSLALSSLGRKFEDFLRELCRRRNELILKDMLMGEALKMGGVRAEYEFSGEDGKASKGSCEVRVYETALVLLPDSGELARLPFCELEGMAQDGFALMIRSEYGSSLRLSMMGRQLDPFRKALSDAAAALTLSAQKAIKDAAPSVTPAQAEKAARLMRDGRAARRAELDAISPAIWEGLRRKVEAAGLKEEYAALEGMSSKEQMCIGLKRSLVGGLEGEYIWILAPIRGRNAAALEATSSEDSGRATYVFRILPEDEYRKGGQAAADTAVPSFIRDVNRCMIAINFRREPIYLDEDALADQRYSAYRFSIARLPQLRRLRSLFKGRAAHNEGWAAGVRSLAE